MKKPLLSITIPTYNRAKFLDIALTNLISQIVPFADLIELLISDNASTDNTIEIIDKHKKSGVNIQYSKNNTNLGIDGNIERCFSLATGKYVWILSDDDILLPTKLKGIISLLQKEDYGNIYLSNFWYSEDYNKQTASSLNTFDYTVYENKEKYLKKVNYWVTFCSGNITNKEILPKTFNPKKYLGTELTLVHWILTASILSQKNVYVNTVTLACKGGNSSGNYKIFKVFGEYLRKICCDVFSEYSISPTVLKHIDNCSLLYFFPMFIIAHKRNNLQVFEKENPKDTLYEQYKENLIFWILNYPLFYLPKRIDRLYQRVVGKFFLITNL